MAINFVKTVMFFKYRKYIPQHDQKKLDSLQTEISNDCNGFKFD